jgi:3-deoxy-manno-octulosonate cytidylyltransferase (CMP-KDO synthetase)
MTSPDCPSGTDRVAEVARLLPEAGVLINVQGDEPLIGSGALVSLAEAFQDPAVEMATLVRALAPEEEENPNVVKAVVAVSGDALYFSRAALPFERDPGATPVPRWAHLGLYGYRRETLLRLAALPPSPLEQVEKLEQLRALEHGIRIRCRETRWRSVGVDTPEDLVRAERVLSAPPSQQH